VRSDNRLVFGPLRENDIEESRYRGLQRCPLSSVFHFCGKVFCSTGILIGIGSRMARKGMPHGPPKASIRCAGSGAVSGNTGVLSQTPAASPSTGSQTASASSRPQRNDGADAIPAGTIIPAALSKSVDAKKAKPGDKIEARITMDLLSNGKVVIPRDTKVIGHVTGAKSRTKESPDSRVGMSFDRISLKDGRELSIRAAIQAMGPSLNNAVAPGMDQLGQGSTGMSSTGPPDSRGPMGGSARPGGSAGSPLPDASSRDASPDVPASEGSAPTALDPHSQGVVGLRGLSLSPSNQGSLVGSNSHNVHLDRGTQLILRTEYHLCVRSGLGGTTKEHCEVSFGDRSIRPL